MRKSDLQKIIKLEHRIQQIVEDEMEVDCLPVEFDIIPPQKMLEIMAYNIPTNISNWKKGRDYEIHRTRYDYGDPGLPYEVVVNSTPAKAYLMNSNTVGQHALVIAHVYGHVGFLKSNK